MCYSNIDRLVFVSKTRRIFTNLPLLTPCRHFQIKMFANSFPYNCRAFGVSLGHHATEITFHVISRSSVFLLTSELAYFIFCNYKTNIYWNIYSYVHRKTDRGRVCHTKFRINRHWFRIKYFGAKVFLNIPTINDAYSLRKSTISCIFVLLQ